MCVCVCGSLVPRPCAFVACSTKFAQREFRTASDERAGPGNEAMCVVRGCYSGWLLVYIRMCSPVHTDGRVDTINWLKCYFASLLSMVTILTALLYLGRVGVVAIANQIFAIGGYDGLTNLNTVEVYSVDEEVWSTAAPMKCHQGGVGVAVIPLD